MILRGTRVIALKSTNNFTLPLKIWNSLKKNKNTVRNHVCQRKRKRAVIKNGEKEKKHIANSSIFESSLQLEGQRLFPLSTQMKIPCFLIFSQLFHKSFFSFLCSCKIQRTLTQGMYAFKNNWSLSFCFFCVYQRCCNVA